MKSRNESWHGPRRYIAEITPKLAKKMYADFPYTYVITF
jgi:hypothetical protein